MPLLAAFLGSVFTSIATFLAEYLTRRVAIAAAVIAVLVSLTAAFVAALNGLMDAVLYVAPDALALGASWVVPANTDECIGAIVSAHLLRWAYDWHVKLPLIRAG